jgi:hypothetical protein
MYLPVHSINYWISTIAKIPSTEQDGGINVMYLYARVCKKGDVAYIRVDCSLENKLPPSDQEVKKAWMTTLLQKKNKMAELMVCLWEEMGLVWPG